MIQMQSKNLAVALVRRMTLGVERFSSPGLHVKRESHRTAPPDRGFPWSPPPSAGLPPQRIEFEPPTPGSLLLPIKRPALPDRPVTPAQQWRTVGRGVDLLA